MPPVKPRPRRAVAAPVRRREGKPPTAHTGAANPDGLPMLRTSERRDFKRCPQRWWWSWIDGLTPKGPPNDKLWFGTGWHLVMAHHYGQPGLKRGKEPLKVWRSWIGEEMPKIRVNISGNAEYREEVYIDAAKLGEEMIGNYLDTYGLDPTWDVIQVEKPFEVVVADQNGVKRVLFCGTYDGVYRDTRTGRIWLMEHKTAKSIITAHLEMDDQADGYLTVAARELKNAGLISKNDRVAGIMYNFARKAIKDDKPRNERGEVTNKPTKEHYIAQLPSVDPKMTLAAMEAMATDLGVTVLGDVSKNQPAPLFQRVGVTRTVHERNSTLQRIQSETQAMAAFRDGTLPVYKNPTKDCSWDCSFYRMCVLHNSGGPDWAEFRDSTFKRQDPYADHRASAGEVEA